MPPTHHHKPVLALLYAATFWGVVWYPLRALEAAGLSGPWQTLVSYAAAALLYLPFARTGHGVSRADLGSLLTLGLAAGWANVAFVLAMLEGSVVRVLLLFYLSPLWATLLARWLIGERVYPRTWFTLPVGLGGAALMLWDIGLGSPLPQAYADWLALSSGFAFALSNVLARRLQGVKVGTKTLISWAGVILVSSVVLARTGGSLPDVAGLAWAGAVALGIAGFFVSTLMVIYGVTHMPAQRSAVILLFEILVGAVTAWWWAGEAMNWQEGCGGAMIVAAGLFAALHEPGEPTVGSPMAVDDGGSER